jgi:cell division protein FtsB
MSTRLIPALLIALLLTLQAQLWIGRGSVHQVSQLKQELATQRLSNEQAQLRNDQLASEVRDLREGLDMVEELARQELGMVKPNEVFVQIAQKRP